MFNKSDKRALKESLTIALTAFLIFLLGVLCLVPFLIVSGCEAENIEEYEEIECVTEETETIKEIPISERFIVAEEQEIGGVVLTIIVDSKTNVTYLITRNTIIPLLDADGNPLQYNKNLLNGYGVENDE